MAGTWYHNHQIRHTFRAGDQVTNWHAPEWPVAVVQAFHPRGQCGLGMTAEMTSGATWLARHLRPAGGQVQGDPRVSSTTYGLPFTKTDGGRAASGFKGTAGDCVCRSIAIAAEIPYAEVYRRLAAETGAQRAGKRGKRTASARNGINTARLWFKAYMAEIGFAWTPTMTIGSGCKTHLSRGELPAGRLVVACSNHYTAVIEGVIHDTHDPSRAGTRCVYGYWIRLPHQKEHNGTRT